MWVLDEVMEGHSQKASDNGSHHLGATIVHRRLEHLTAVLGLAQLQCCGRICHPPYQKLLVFAQRVILKGANKQGVGIVVLEKVLEMLRVCAQCVPHRQPPAHSLSHHRHTMFVLGKPAPRLCNGIYETGVVDESSVDCLQSSTKHLASIGITPQFPHLSTERLCQCFHLMGRILREQKLNDVRSAATAAQGDNALLDNHHTVLPLLPRHPPYPLLYVFIEIFRHLIDGSTEQLKQGVYGPGRRPCPKPRCWLHGHINRVVG
mmetsp:Transcript_22349/g.37441  ORF Transcript_22349/g.37441 Transcript_22349/m.37441 type:complete len:262 (+) Transcript_22349:1474-2259(+)